MAKSALVFFFIFVSCVSCVLAQTELVKPCNNSRSTSLSFAIVSKKNETGHWVAEVKMGPEITDGHHNGGWQVHVDQNTVDNSGNGPIVHIKATITAPAAVPPGYEFFPGVGYYKLYTAGKTWAEAKAICAQEKTHLAIINSEAESEVIRQLFARYPNLGGLNAAAFVGFHDKETEGEYVTIYGDSLASTGFTRWSTIGKQPDNAPPGEDCGSVLRNGALNDLGCDNKAPFFCEQDLYAGSNGNKYDSGHTVTGGGPKKPKTRLIDARLDGVIEEGDTNIITDEIPAE